MPALGLIAWLTAVAATKVSLGSLFLFAIAVLATAAAIPALRTPTVLAWLLLGCAVAAGVVLRGGAVRESPVVALAHSRAMVTGVLDVSTDPRIVTGRFGSRVLVRGSLREVTGRGYAWALRTPVLVLAPTERTGTADPWRSVRYGSRIRFWGRLGPTLDDTLAATVSANGAPATVRGPPMLVRAVDHVRAGIRDAASGLSPASRGLVPALIDGDDSRLSQDLRRQFQVVSLTHLLAVSGTNLRLVVGFALLISRWLGLRGHALTVVGALAVVGFVLLARAEPSVLRAAAMGSVALLGFGNAGPRRAPRVLGGAVVALMLVSPGLAVTPGFVLSVLATAGIVFLSPSWAAAMRGWLPSRVGWLAEAIAVPTAAQLACTPVIAVLSAQISVVAVPANMLAAVAVAPTTIIGLVAGLVQLVWPSAAALVAVPGGWGADWIVAVAHWGAHTATPATGFADSVAARILLALGCLAAVPLLDRVFAHAWATGLSSASLCLVVMVPLAQIVPHPGWPPRGWLMVACDVGQGDGLVLRVGQHRAIVVDTGPDPRPMDACLRSLAITTVPLVVLTHFHADHIDGLTGVLDGRRVGMIEVSPYAVPESGAAQVRALAARARVPVVTAEYGQVRALGPLRWQVLAPSAPAPASSDSPPNDDSVVMLVESGGIRLLLMGDQETDSQRRLRLAFPRLRADVLKVAHHGSAKQDPELVRSIGARVGLISVGRDNDYGHPAPSLLRLLGDSGIRAYRTDRDGAVAIAVRQGELVVVHRR